MATKGNPLTRLKIDDGGSGRAARGPSEPKRHCVPKNRNYKAALLTPLQLEGSRRTMLAAAAAFSPTEQEQERRPFTLIASGRRPERRLDNAPRSLQTLTALRFLYAENLTFIPSLVALWLINVIAGEDAHRTLYHKWVSNPPR